MSKTEENTAPVRVDKSLIGPMKKLQGKARDEFGSQKYRSLRQIVDTAVRDLLHKEGLAKRPLETPAR